MNRKILIADDEIHIRMLLEQTLEDLEEDSVELHFAENGMQALEIIRAEIPSLVFLDVMMPRMNGMDVCHLVKKDHNLAEVTIVLLTAKGQEVDRQKGLEVGADQYITKPFDPDQILRMTKDILRLNLS